MSSGMQGGLPSDCRVLNWINDPLHADVGYLRLHHKMIKVNWHQYIECTSMRVGKLNDNLSLKALSWTYLGSAQLKNMLYSRYAYKAI